MSYDKEKYLANAKAIKTMLEQHEEFVPHMRNYCSLGEAMVLEEENHTCGTSYCLAGYQAHLQNYPKEFRVDGWDTKFFDYEGFSEYVSGAEDSNMAWSFIYSSHWPDTRESAYKRVNYVIENNGEIPDDFDIWLENGWLGNPELHQLLKQGQ